MESCQRLSEETDIYEQEDFNLGLMRCTTLAS